MTGINRFMHLSDAELADLEKVKVAKSTTKSTSNALKTFLAFCKEENYNSIQDISLDELNSLLTKFYAGARTLKGELYKMNSLRGIRSGLQRHFQEVRGIDIINDNDFNTANRCFKNVLSKVKVSSKGKVDHHPEVEPEDIDKLYNSIDIYTARGLQEKVWLDVVRYFIRRGMENQREMTKDTFAVSKDASGLSYVYQVTDELSKNHNEEDAPNDTNGEGRMYSTGNDRCPVTSFLMYVTKLNPACDAFWQRPLDNAGADDWVWYANVPLGVHKLGEMLASMSIKYNLSQRYTNHSLRVTSCQALEDAGVEGRHIVGVSGHKNPDSLKHYARKLSAARKRHISSIIADGGSVDFTRHQQPTAKVPAVSTVKQVVEHH